VFFDLVKIRKYVDEATNLAVRAAAGLASSMSPKDSGLFGAAGVLGLGLSGPAPRLSRERKHRMRELATQKLAKAYKLDEIAASVATMQSASSLEDVANLVLKRDPADPDAMYVHFFHEKIPSRMLADCTSLAPLDRVIDERASEGAPLRTRAVTRMFKDDYAGTVQDLTLALNVFKMHNRPQQSHDMVLAAGSKESTVTGTTIGGIAKVDDDDQPSSLEAQLLFHRASAYLYLACHSVDAALDPASADTDAAKKTLRTHAKRALRDYTRFLSHFEYCPAADAADAAAAVGAPADNIYAVHSLFAQHPPSLPPASPNQEAVTYHPLLTDALHSLLLTHTLLGTPRKELKRHAVMVARLCRVADGYPIFLAARSPARADWMEVLRKASPVVLEASWEQLCIGGDAGAEGGGEIAKEYPISTERAGNVTRWVKAGGASGGNNGSISVRLAIAAAAFAPKAAT
jgi:hypothetical protein